MEVPDAELQAAAGQHRPKLPEGELHEAARTLGGQPAGDWHDPRSRVAGHSLSVPNPANADRERCRDARVQNLALAPSDTNELTIVVCQSNATRPNFRFVLLLIDLDTYASLT